MQLRLSALLVFKISWLICLRRHLLASTFYTLPPSSLGRMELLWAKTSRNKSSFSQFILWLNEGEISAALFNICPDILIKFSHVKGLVEAVSRLMFHSIFQFFGQWHSPVEWGFTSLVCVLLFFNFLIFGDRPKVQKLDAAQFQLPLVKSRTTLAPRTSNSIKVHSTPRLSRIYRGWETSIRKGHMVHYRLGCRIS